MGSEVTYGIGGQVPHDMYTAGASNSSQRKFAWEDVGLGDGFKDAQGIVGQEGGGGLPSTCTTIWTRRAAPLTGVCIR